VLPEIMASLNRDHRSNCKLYSSLTEILLMLCCISFGKQID